MTGPPSPPRSLPRLRWWVAATLFLASALTYIDRQALSVLATTMQKDLGIDDRSYAVIGQAFLFAYALCYLPAGWLVDRFGARAAQTGFILWWSLANAATGLVSTAGPLAACRGLLGAGEAGNFPAAAKAVAQWFPPRERSLAVGLYTMGGTVGAAAAAPLAALIALHWDWRAVFVTTGAAGLGLAAWWWWLYRPPSLHPRLGTREAALLADAGVIGGAPPAAVPMRRLLAEPALWVLVGCRLITDPVWYFYLVWFAKYLQEVRGMSLGEVGATAWVVFVAADIGCALGAWCSRHLVRMGMPVVRARLTTMAGAALLASTGALQPLVGGSVLPLVLGAIAALACLAWITNAVTLLVDLVPANAIGRAQGVVGTAGALGGALSTGVVGWLVTTASYDTAFVCSALLHPFAIVAMAVLMRRIGPATRKVSS